MSTPTLPSPDKQQPWDIDENNEVQLYLEAGRQLLLKRIAELENRPLSAVAEDSRDCGLEELSLTYDQLLEP